MAAPPDQRSISELVSDALSQLTMLVRNEIQLARSEMSEKVSRSSIGLGMIAGGAALALAALVVLLLAIAALIAETGLPPWVSIFIAALLGGGASAALAWAGLQRLKAQSFTPERTIQQLRRDKLAAKEQVR